MTPQEWEDFLHENYDADGVAQSQLERATYMRDYLIFGWENWENWENFEDREGSREEGT